VTSPEPPVEGDCIVLVEAVTAYLDGVLAADDRVRFEAHLAGCEGCRTYLDQMRSIPQAIAVAHTATLPADVRAALLRAFTAAQ
jgi:predicted anti-sigma-YlaC factor YlaD